ncbi:class I SAM-dependent methyltransferase [Micromonospora aurantiaca (nom. illeg.)]|uniref:class I SAM-dependent methyltransferase n=1 Tax=Micromonospora aurantiaca (nom. illeg.) TaxID=47850 RepID=UPI0001BF1D97|nr:class I SAM-dependent methyltransferase [Micromonospora aurantiaca]ADL47590.1 Methyltransferase type 12 [Micromonospora aurantiaca ATCC 27029]
MTRPSTLNPEDVARWRRDWDTMMRHYHPDRDDLLAAGLAAAEQIRGRQPERMLDVGGGPGTTAEAVLRRWPDAHVTVLDVDPALLALADVALPQVRAVRADISSAGWLASAGGPYDLVLALMALHYLPEDRVRDWYAEARRLLSPNALLLVSDAMPDAPTAARAHRSGSDPWTAWWTMLARDPAMASLLHERTAALSDLGCAEFVAPPDWHRETALAAGFTDATVVRRRAGHALMAFLEPPDDQ